MENKKSKLEPYQKVLFVFSSAFLAVGAVLLILRIMNIFDLGASTTVAFVSLSCIFQNISLWKTNPKTATMLIAANCVLFGLCLAGILDKLFEYIVLGI